MKTLLLMIALTCSYIFAQAQAVGIGIAAPDESAILHLNSTTKGILIPSMTSTQRNAIQNPTPGLLVYDLTADRIFVRRNNTWQFFIDNSYWAQSSTRNWVYNGTDSVGIGNAAPNERLHVSGNIRSSGDLKLSGNAGIGVTSPEQSLHVRSSSPSEGMIIEAVNPIIQLRQSNTPQAGYTDKGFIQLSGDNIRIGTNSANDNGSVVLRTNAQDRVIVKPNGDMQIGTRITSAVTGDINLTPLCFGITASISTGGVKRGTSNVSVTRVATGQYIIHCAGLNEDSLVMVTGFANNVFVSAIYNNTPGQFIVFTRSTSGADIDQLFKFIAY